MSLLLDSFATDSGERYVGLLNNFRIILWNAMRQDPRDYRQRDYLKKSSVQAAQVFRETEETMFEFALKHVTQTVEAQLKADIGVDVRFEEIEFASEYLLDLQEYFHTELTSQLQRDVAQVERRYSDFTLEVFMTARVSHNPQEAHLMALIDTRDQVKFYFKDRSGRRHMSQKFIRVSVRHALLTAAIELYAIGAAFSADHMEIIHKEGGSKTNGMKIGFRKEQGFPLLSDVRDEIFHPNSNAFLKAVM